MAAFTTATKVMTIRPVVRARRGKRLPHLIYLKALREALSQG